MYIIFGKILVFNRREYQNKYQQEHVKEMREYRRKYREKHREELNAHGREKYYKHLEYQRQRSRDKYRRFRERWLAYSRNRRAVTKKFAVAYYTDGRNCCACCGENEIKFMTLDHINNNGAEHRKSLPRGTRMIEWVVENYFPDGFQILCFNCNCAKGSFGECPHQTKIKRSMTTV